MDVKINDITSRIERLPQGLKNEVLVFIDGIERRAGINKEFSEVKSDGKYKLAAAAYEEIWEKMKNEDPDEIESVIKEACENTLW